MSPLTRYAALVAPAVDRVFAGTMRATRDLGGRDLVLRYGRENVVWLIDFRTALAWPGRSVSPEGFAEVTRYRDPAQSQAWLATAVSAGLLSLDPAGGFRATARGHEFLREQLAVHTTATAQLWAGHEKRLERLAGTLATLLGAADATGGGAWRAMAPPYEPPDASLGLLVHNRIGTLRYHRSDAHAAAWRAAGLTPAQMVALPPGELREHIEAETNRLAATPYAVLDDDRRLEFLADLAALPTNR